MKNNPLKNYLDINNNNNREQKDIQIIDKKALFLEKLEELFKTGESAFGFKEDINTILADIELDKTNYLKFVTNALIKTTRSIEESRLVTSLLFYMDDFIKLIKPQDTNKDINILNELVSISSKVIYEKLPKDSLFIRLGEKGKKAYILFKGEVEVLVPQPKKMLLSENDYLFFLSNLVKYGEFGLANLNINENFNIFPMYIFDDITRDLKKGKKVKIKPDQRESYAQFLEELKSFKDKQKLKDGTKRFLASELLKTYDMEFQVKKSNANINRIDTHTYINRLDILSDRRGVNNMIDSCISKLSDFRIYIYIKVATLKEGSFFGQMALNDPQALRTATIISTQDCHLGSLNKQTYEQSVKIGTEKQLKLILIYLITLDLFRGLTTNFFLNKYYNQLTHLKYVKGKEVINQNEYPDHLTLIRTGTFEISTKSSLNNLSRQMFHYLDKISEYQDMTIESKYLEKSIFEKKQLCGQNIIFNKFYNREQNIRLTDLEAPEIIGLEEYLNERGTYFYNIKSTSPESEVFLLSHKFYEDMKYKSYKLRNNYKNYIINKYMVFYSRLRSIYETMCKSFVDQKVDIDYGKVLRIELDRKIALKARNRRKFNKMKEINSYEQLFFKTTNNDRKENTEKSQYDVKILCNSMKNLLSPKNKVNTISKFRWDRNSINKKEFLSLKHSDVKDDKKKISLFNNLKLKALNIKSFDEEKINSSSSEECIYHNNMKDITVYPKIRLAKNYRINDLIWENIKNRMNTLDIAKYQENSSQSLNNSKRKEKLTISMSDRKNLKNSPRKQIIYSLNYKAISQRHKRHNYYLKSNIDNRLIDLSEATKMKKEKFLNKRNQYLKKNYITRIKTVYGYK